MKTTRGPVAERLSPEWVKYVRETGRWNEPPFWREPAYQNESPWSPDELEQAAAAVLRVYAPDVTRKMLRERTDGAVVWSIVADFVMPAFSGFLSFGFEAAAAEPWLFGSLTKRLRDGREYEGARFEMELLAAFRRSSVSTIVDPLAKDKNSQSPDFQVELPPSVFLEAKLARKSKNVEEENAWFEKLTLADSFMRGRPLQSPLPYRIELTDEFETLQRSETGRRWIRKNVDRLQGLVRESFVALQRRGTPAGVVIDGLVSIQVRAPGAANGREHRGVPTHGEREAARIVTGCVTDGANQFPTASRGIVVVRSGLDAPPLLLVQEVARWLDEEGANYPETVGVVLVVDDFSASVPLTRVLPVWKPDSSGDWQEPTLWLRVEQGLNWREIRVLEWRQRRGG